MITKKNSCGSKIPPPPHNFSNGRSLKVTKFYFRCEPDVSPLTSLWHHTKFRKMLKTVAYKMGSFWIYNINQLQDSRKKKIKVSWAKLHFLTKRTGWKNGTALYETVWEQQKSTGNEKTFSSSRKFYSFYLKLEWTKLDVQNLRLFVILGQKSGVFV